MPVYEYVCDCCGKTEVLAALGAPAPSCPACGGGTRKVMSGFAVVGRADSGLSQSQMPQTWKGTYGGNREYVTGLQHQWERRQRLEDRYPELAGDRRPIVAHEGPHSLVPLRAGDPGDSRADRVSPRAPGGSDSARPSHRGSAGEGHHRAHPQTHPGR